MLTEFKHIFHLLRNPDTAIVTQGLTHEGKFALLVSMNRNTGRMDLCKARISKVSTFPVCLHGSRTIRIHCICGKEVCISITTGSKNYCMGTEALNLTSYQVTCYNTLSFTVNYNKVKHFVPGITLYRTGCNLLI